MAILNRSVARSQTKAAAPASLRLGPVLLAAGIAIVAVGLLQVVQTSRATTASFAIQRLEQEKLELETTVRQLEADVAGLSSLTRIEQEAKRLGLGPPQASESVSVNVPWPRADLDRLPTRFLPAEGAQPGVGERDEPWWRDLLELLPFD